MKGLRVFGREFRPGALSTVALAAFVALTVSLGNWQWRRAEDKTARARAFDDPANRAVLSVPSSPARAEDFEQRRVSARGSYDAKRTILLDNRVLRGMVGYHVLTPLKLEGGEMHVLVNRGWGPAGPTRGVLPRIETPQGVQTVEGLAAVPGKRIFELAPDTATGPVRQHLVLERLEKELGIRLQPFVVQQTSDSRDGLVRAWERPDAGADTNRSYALQWYSLALLAIILYVVLNLKRPGTA